MAPVLSRTPARRLLALLPSPHSTAHTLVASSSAWRWRAPRTAARGTWVQPERGGSRGFSVFPANRGVFRPWINASEQDELEYRDMHLEAPLHRGVGKEDMTRSLPPLMGATLVLLPGFRKKQASKPPNPPQNCFFVPVFSCCEVPLYSLFL